MFLSTQINSDTPAFIFKTIQSMAIPMDITSIVAATALFFLTFIAVNFFMRLIGFIVWPLTLGLYFLVNNFFTSLLNKYITVFTF